MVVIMTHPVSVRSVKNSGVQFRFTAAPTQYVSPFPSLRGLLSLTALFIWWVRKHCMDKKKKKNSIKDLHFNLTIRHHCNSSSNSQKLTITPRVKAQHGTRSSPVTVNTKLSSACRPPNRQGCGVNTTKNVCVSVCLLRLIKQYCSMVGGVVVCRLIKCDRHQTSWDQTPNYPATGRPRRDVLPLNSSSCGCFFPLSWLLLIQLFYFIFNLIVYFVPPSLHYPLLYTTFLPALGVCTWCDQRHACRDHQLH